MKCKLLFQKNSLPRKIKTFGLPETVLESWGHQVILSQSFGKLAVPKLWFAKLSVILTKALLTVIQKGNLTEQSPQEPPIDTRE